MQLGLVWSVPIAKSDIYTGNNGRSIAFHILPMYTPHPTGASVLGHEANGHA